MHDYKKLDGIKMHDFLRSGCKRGLRTNSPNSTIVMIIFQVMILVLRLVYFGHIYRQLFPILKQVIKTGISSYNDNNQLRTGLTARLRYF